MVFRYNMKSLMIPLVSQDDLFHFSHGHLSITGVDFYIFSLSLNNDVLITLSLWVVNPSLIPGPLIYSYIKGASGLIILIKDGNHLIVSKDRIIYRDRSITIDIDKNFIKKLIDSSPETNLVMIIDVSGIALDFYTSLKKSLKNKCFVIYIPLPNLSSVNEHIKYILALNSLVRLLDLYQKMKNDSEANVRFQTTFNALEEYLLSSYILNVALGLDDIYTDAISKINNPFIIKSIENLFNMSIKDVSHHVKLFIYSNPFQSITLFKKYLNKRFTLKEFLSEVDKILNSNPQKNTINKITILITLLIKSGLLEKETLKLILNRVNELDPEILLYLLNLDDGINKLILERVKNFNETKDADLLELRNCLIKYKEIIGLSLQ